MLYTRPSRRQFLHAGALTAAAGAALGQAPAPQRPRYRLTIDETFDPRAVRAYAGHHERIYAHIDAHADAHVGHLQRWLRQRSISAQNDGVIEMARLVRDDLRELGFREAELVPTSGHPGVWGFYDAGAPKTLMVYLMYDVQPVDPEDWTTPPFAAELAETELGTVVRARGATNQKGPERAFLNALESILAVEGTLPVNIMVAAEGEEELGSPHYPEIVDRYEARLKTCDGAFFPFNSQSATGEMSMDLGVKGILYLEIEAAGGPNGGPTKSEIHGSFKALVDSPVWRLVQALATLTTPDGNTITVPGYYDPVRPPTAEEQRLIRRLLGTWEEAGLRRGLGVERWIDGISGEEAILSYLYHPTLNIDGIWAGYTGEGVKTILPHRAAAKVDSRLPPGLSPEAALDMIRRHLERQGFGDLTIRRLSGYPAAQTSVESGLITAAIGVANKYDLTPVVWPRLAGSAPFYQFTDRLKLPLLFTGFGHGSGAHGPNEYMVIRPKPGSRVFGLSEIEKGYVDLLYALAGM